MNKVFKCFHMSALINFQNSNIAVYQGNQNFRKEVTKISHTAGQNWMSKMPNFDYCNRTDNADIPKFINRNLSKTGDQRFSHFLLIFFTLRNYYI